MKLAAFLGLLAACAALGSSLAAAEAPPALVEQALKSYSDSLTGFVVYERHRSGVQKAPGNNASNAATTVRLRSGRQIVALKVRALSVNGTPSSAEDISKRQAELEKALPIDTLAELPINEKTIAQTHFDAPVACGECGPGIMTVKFKALVADKEHYSGTLYIDEHAPHFTKIIATPTVLQKPATAGTETYIFAQVMTGLWDLQRLDAHYEGKMMMIKGTYDYSIVHDKFRRVTSLDEGKKSLSE